MKRRSRVGRLCGLSLLLVGMLAFAVAFQKIMAPDHQVAAFSHGFQTDAIRFSPDGRWLLSTGIEELPSRKLEYSTRIRRTDNWKDAHRLPHAELAGDLTADSRRFLTLSDSGQVELREADGGGGWRRRPLPSPLKNCQSAALSPDGRRIAALFKSPPHLALYRNGTYQRVAELGQAVEIAGFSPDGRLLAFTTHSDAAGWKYLFADPETGRILHQAPGHCVAFPPDGTLAMGTDAVSTLTLWDTRTWKVVRKTYTRYPYVRSLAFSPDSQMLAVGHDDGMVLRDLESGRELIRLAGSFSRRQVAFAPHAPLLALLQGNTIELWHIPPHSELMLRSFFR